MTALSVPRMKGKVLVVVKTSLVLLVAALVLILCLVNKQSRVTTVINLEGISDKYLMRPVGNSSKEHSDTRATMSYDAEAQFAIPMDNVLNTLEDQQLATIYLDFLTNLQVLCKNKTRIGGVRGWEVCLDGHYNIQHSNCLVYSFGMESPDFNFAVEMKEKFGCEVQVYDPSLGNRKDRPRLGERFLHPVGVGDNVQFINSKRKGPPIRTMADIKTRSGHYDSWVDYLQMDIEESEWNVLTRAELETSMYHVKQLGVEFHRKRAETRGWYLRKLQMLRNIYEAGYRIFYSNTITSGRCLMQSESLGREEASCHRVYFLKWLMN